MADDAARPGTIRMTAHSEPAASNEGGMYLMWTLISVLVFILVSMWSSFAGWFTPPVFFGMLFVYLVFVVWYRADMLEKANPHAQHTDLVGSLIVVLGGYVIGIFVVIAHFLFWWRL